MQDQVYIHLKPRNGRGVTTLDLSQTAEKRFINNLCCKGHPTQLYGIAISPGLYTYLLLYTYGCTAVLPYCGAVFYDGFFLFNCINGY